MHYFDLSRCTYFGDDVATSLVSVGWLTDSVEFDCGETLLEAYTRIKELVHDAWQPFVFCGMHSCELCQYDPPMGGSNLFVPDGSQIFVCPELIVHYMAAHHYRPPTTFLDAVMSCPDTRSMDYKRLLLASGGRGLIRSL